MYPDTHENTRIYTHTKWRFAVLINRAAPGALQSRLCKLPPLFGVVFSLYSQTLQLFFLCTCRWTHATENKVMWKHTRTHTCSQSLASIREPLTGVWGGVGVKGESVLMGDVGGLFCLVDHHCHVHSLAHAHTKIPQARLFHHVCLFLSLSLRFSPL